MEARALEFSYQEIPFIKEFNLKISKGKITTILGPNGSGKSTILNLLANQYRPKQGDIYIDNTNIRELKTKEMAKKLAVVYQHNNAPSDITVRGLVEYGRIPHKKLWESQNDQDEAIIDEVLKITNLEQLSNKRVSNLSGGERQRAWIAMALAQKTDFLFLDEPTTYLDIFYQMELLEMVRNLNKNLGLTVVMVLHDINQAIQFSDEIIVMKSGKIVSQGTPSEIMTPALLQEVYGINAAIRWCPINECQYIVPTKHNKGD